MKYYVYSKILVNSSRDYFFFFRYSEQVTNPSTPLTLELPSRSDIFFNDMYFGYYICNMLHSTNKNSVAKKSLKNDFTLTEKRRCVFIISVLNCHKDCCQQNVLMLDVECHIKLLISPATEKAVQEIISSLTLSTRCLNVVPTGFLKSVLGSFSQLNKLM